MLKGIDKYLFYHVCNKHSCWIFRFILFYFWYVEFFRIFGKNKICPFQCWCCCSLCNLIFSIWFSHWWIVFKFFRLFFFSILKHSSTTYSHEDYTVFGSELFQTKPKSGVFMVHRCSYNTYTHRARERENENGKIREKSDFITNTKLRLHQYMHDAYMQNSTWICIWFHFIRHFGWYFRVSLYALVCWRTWMAAHAHSMSSSRNGDFSLIQDTMALQVLFVLLLLLSFSRFSCFFSLQRYVVFVVASFIYGHCITVPGWAYSMRVLKHR